MLSSLFLIILCRPIKFSDGWIRKTKTPALFVLYGTRRSGADFGKYYLDEAVKNSIHKFN
jgi:hypothetical protein